MSRGPLENARRAVIRAAACRIAEQALLIEREVEATSECAQLVMELYRLADEIQELADDKETPL